jgi:hypothetical protein
MTRLPSRRVRQVVAAIVLSIGVTFFGVAAPSRATDPTASVHRDG